MRYVGIILEVLGVVTVAVGIGEKRRVFDRPTLFRLFQQWVRRFPKPWGSAHIVGAGGISAGGASGSAYAYGWSGPPEDPSVHARLDALEKNVETVRRLALDAQKQVQEEATARQESLAQEQRLRAAADEELRKRLDAFGAGNLHIEAIGIFWLIMGVLLANAPGEVVQLLGMKR